MANVKISDLTAYTDPVATDVLPIVDLVNDQTKKVKVEDLLKRFAAGTEALPSFAFTGDVDTGIYSPGANQFAVSTGGTQRLLIDASGNTTIQGDLTVNGTTTTIESTTLSIDDKNIELGTVSTPSDTTADGGGITLKGATDKTINWVQSTGCWTFNQPTNFNNHVRIDSSGNVGIGITSADEDLHVFSSAGAIKIDGSGDTALRFATSGTNKFSIFHSNDTLRFFDNSNSAERMRIDSSGMINIPWGTARVASVFDNSYRHGMAFNASSRQLQIFSTTNDSGGDIVFSTRVGTGASDTDYGTERVRIDSSGRLLVGTTSSITANTYAKVSVVDSVGAEISLGRNDSSVTEANSLGAIRFYGNDGGSYQECAHIIARADGTHANDDKPTRLVFSTTPSGSSTSSERMRIDSSGRLLVGASSSPTAGSGNIAKSVIQGNTSNSAGAGYLSLQRGQAAASISSGGTLGLINFADSAGNDYAIIKGRTGAAGGSNDYPGELIFATTADGASSTTDRMVIDSSGNVTLYANLDLQDNDKILLGTGDDLQIYHDGSNSYIDDAGAGNLILNGNEVRIQSNDNSEMTAKFITNGAVELYYDNSKKLETKSGGIDVTGQAQASDIVIAPTTANAFRVYNDANFTNLTTQILPDGSASFAKSNTTFTTAGFDIGSNGVVTQYVATSTTTVKPYTLSSNVGGTKVEKISFAADGDATFAGDVLSGSATDGVTLYSNGVINAVRSSAGSSSSFFWKGIANSVETSTIATDGSATFNGVVKIGAGSTVTPDANADDFVIDKGAADTGLSILSTTTGRIYFGDAADHEAGSIRYVHTDNSLRFETASSERIRIDSSGRLLVGHSAAISTTALGAAQAQIVGTDNVSSQLSVSRFSNDNDRPRLTFIKSRSGTKGTNTIVQSGDAIGRIEFLGADGSATNDYPIAAHIGVEVDGTPGADDMPGRIILATTADGASSPTERLRIDSSGHITPGANGTQDLGSTSKRFANLYTSDLDLSNEAKGGNDVDGTWGSYTIQEGEEDLFLINKRSGKKYKFMLQEVS